MPFYRIVDGETFGLADQYKAGDVLELPEHEATPFIGFKLDGPVDEPEDYQAQKAEHQRLADEHKERLGQAPYAPVVVKAEPGSVVHPVTGQPVRRPEQHTGQPQDMRHDTDHTGVLTDEEKAEKADREVKAAEQAVEEAKRKADAVKQKAGSPKPAYDQTKPTPVASAVQPQGQTEPPFDTLDAQTVQNARKSKG